MYAMSVPDAFLFMGNSVQIFTLSVYLPKIRYQFVMLSGQTHFRRLFLQRCGGGGIWVVDYYAVVVEPGVERLIISVNELHCLLLGLNNAEIPKSPKDDKLLGHFGAPWTEGFLPGAS